MVEELETRLTCEAGLCTPAWRVGVGCLGGGGNAEGAGEAAKLPGHLFLSHGPDATTGSQAGRTPSAIAPQGTTDPGHA